MDDFFRSIEKTNARVAKLEVENARLRSLGDALRRAMGRAYQDSWKDVRACGPCSGRGYRKSEAGIREECDFCGGNGARRNCGQRDCYEYGCSFDYCYVPDDIAREKGFPLTGEGE